MASNIPLSNLSTRKFGTPCHILDLPYDVYVEIFSHLSWKTHVVCMDVCTFWRQILLTPHAKAKRFSTDSNPRVHQMFKSVFLRHTSILQITHRNQEIVSVQFKRSMDDYDDSHYEKEDKVLWGLELWEPRHPILDDYLFSQGDPDDVTKEAIEFYRPLISGIKLIVLRERRHFSVGISMTRWMLDNTPKKLREVTLRGVIRLLANHVYKIPGLQECSDSKFELLPNGVDDLSLLTVRGRLWLRD
ncbi:hypothetical protein TWF173_001796 [Orbilia oligospora]|uniref:F-box domain-containing protein n=2 Tax=Orbilia oligospora TaxID=2813651 RepID=G1XAF3_ARTOA|nr:hypothetical protein AOL_s00076g611 [Orbilia oligospora ATCC 24927]EGX49970.1 hypothetical protein AOL_s00076g611 [Orbilia oligospora ATCC 24927]KAF3270082.1 hypothetical protein TWF970_010862 [Orbilia oligospora]KAF3316509.1 hypothetical protein TWF173_001796 [Orbilia oligospora]